MCSELRRGDCDFFFCHRRRRWEIDTVAQLKAAEECKKKKVREKEREKEGEIGEQKSFSLWRFDSPHLLQNISLSSIFSSPRVRGHTAETTGETNGQRWTLNTEHLWHSLFGAGQWSPGRLPWLPDARYRRVSIHGGYKCSCTTGTIWLLLLLSLLVHPQCPFGSLQHHLFLPLWNLFQISDFSPSLHRQPFQLIEHKEREQIKLLLLLIGVLPLLGVRSFWISLIGMGNPVEDEWINERGWMQKSECTRKVAVNCEHGERGKEKGYLVKRNVWFVVFELATGFIHSCSWIFFGYFCYIHCLGTCLTLFTLFHPSTVRMMLIISRISFSCAIKRQKRRVQEPFICLPTKSDK